MKLCLVKIIYISYNTVRFNYLTSKIRLKCDLLVPDSLLGGDFYRHVRVPGIRGIPRFLAFSRSFLKSVQIHGENNFVYNVVGKIVASNGKKTSDVEYICTVNFESKHAISTIYGMD